ncbi:YIP1 family protein [Baia soyae]|uniref:Yip1-like protein n=1 Tax=Baia soyae TaxID=1544746 RepID=A0A4R2RZW1_9BACL|nr:YIP1 family protein [Baia soyae]TCP69074.1 Yip1-like protein [Baia soyae]
MKKISLLGIITNPKEQFEAMKSNPTISWAPLLLLFLLAVFIYAYTDDPSFFTFAGNSGVHIGLSVIFAIVVLTIVFLFLSLLTMFTSWIMQGLVKLFGGRIAFKQSFSLNMNLWVITLLGLVFHLILAMLFHDNPEIQYTSLASILPVKGFWEGVLSCVELFEIWFTVLLAMGLTTLANLTAKKAWIIAILFWMLLAVMVGLASTL